ncbi:MAG: S-methyl-5-thioribose-1-phosphate isomerase [Oscillospiraceae bacterium]|jgi:methylthioribose-1-phosphate isomerase|nr:S-methyl-5-thioribose-1-phosphate isomerase [Oscillospiraceae bacterium]
MTKLPDTVRLEGGCLEIIDQTLLPGQIKILRLRTKEEIYYAIRQLKVRGAPAIGVAAAIGVYLAALDIKVNNFEDFYDRFLLAKIYLNSARPTAVNLSWALDRMEKCLLNNSENPVDEILNSLKNEALAIWTEDIEVCKKIGENGLQILEKNSGILTHCNAGQLAAVRYGTATAPIYRGHELGYNFKIFADETRPLLQGSRLTAFELDAAGIDVTLICDNMASAVMRQGKIQAVLTGCDRVAANGDTANKIGTSGVAILAKYYNIPFYICAPSSTIDLGSRSGADIKIEERDSLEVTEMWFHERMAPEGISVYNPAFDVTDAELISGIITEFGIVKAPYAQNLPAMIAG